MGTWEVMCHAFNWLDCKSSNIHSARTKTKSQSRETTISSVLQSTKMEECKNCINLSVGCLCCEIFLVLRRILKIFGTCRVFQNIKQSSVQPLLIQTVTMSSFQIMVLDFNFRYLYWNISILRNFNFSPFQGNVGFSSLQHICLVAVIFTLRFSIQSHILISVLSSFFLYFMLSSCLSFFILPFVL